MLCRLARLTLDPESQWPAAEGRGSASSQSGSAKRRTACPEDVRIRGGRPRDTGSHPPSGRRPWRAVAPHGRVAGEGRLMAQPPKPPTSAETPGPKPTPQPEPRSGRQPPGGRRRAASRADPPPSGRGRRPASTRCRRRTPQLTPEDRRRSLKSLAGKEAPRRVVPGGTASRWALIPLAPSLPRPSPRASAGLVVPGSDLRASHRPRQHTPEGVVLSNTSQSVPGRLQAEERPDRLRHARARHALRPRSPGERGGGAATVGAPGSATRRHRSSVDAVHWRR